MSVDINKLAQENFELVKKVLDDHDTTYNEDNLLVSFWFNNKDTCDYCYIIRVYPKQRLISLRAIPDFEVNKDKIKSLAIATSQLNHLYNDGCFDFDIQDPCISFRLTTNYWDSILSEDVITYLMNISLNALEEECPVLEKINHGSLTIEEFLEKC